MYAVILAGGKGSRLGSLTKSIPKPMVKIGGKPIIWHLLKILNSNGINNFIICLGYKGNVIKNSGGATAITMSTDSTNPSVTTPAALIAGGQITTTQLKATTGAGANKMLKSDANGLLSYVSFGVFASDGVTRLGP